MVRSKPCFHVFTMSHISRLYAELDCLDLLRRWNGSFDGRIGLEIPAYRHRLAHQ